MIQAAAPTTAGDDDHGFYGPDDFYALDDTYGDDFYDESGNSSDSKSSSGDQTHFPYTVAFVVAIFATVVIGLYRVLSYRSKSRWTLIRFIQEGGGDTPQSAVAEVGEREAALHRFQNLYESSTTGCCCGSAGTSILLLIRGLSFIFFSAYSCMLFYLRSDNSRRELARFDSWNIFMVIAYFGLSMAISLAVIVTSAVKKVESHLLIWPVRTSELVSSIGWHCYEIAGGTAIFITLTEYIFRSHSFIDFENEKLHFIPSCALLLDMAFNALHVRPASYSYSLGFAVLYLCTVWTLIKTNVIEPPYSFLDWHLQKSLVGFTVLFTIHLGSHTIWVLVHVLKERIYSAYHTNKANGAKINNNNNSRPNRRNRKDTANDEEIGGLELQPEVALLIEGIASSSGKLATKQPHQKRPPLQGALVTDTYNDSHLFASGGVASQFISEMDAPGGGGGGGRGGRGIGIGIGGGDGYISDMYKDEDRISLIIHSYSRRLNADDHCLNSDFSP